VQSEKLVADEVLAGGKGRRNLRGVREALHDLAGTPAAGHLGAGDEAKLGDLEPIEVGAVRARTRATARRHVDHDRALSVGPLRPVGDDLGAGSNSSGQLAAASGTIVVAADGRVGGRENPVAANISIVASKIVAQCSRVVRAVRTLDGCLSRGAVERLPARVGGAGDLVRGHTSVSSSSANKGGGNENGRKHICDGENG
jgi:hypothetical protein